MEDVASTLDSTSEDVHYWKEQLIQPGVRLLYSITLDYSISTLHERIRDKTIDLDPSFQRRNKWDLSQKSKLIESLILGIPIPPIFLSEQADGSYAVIDGKQRLNTISEFLSGKFKLRGLVVYSRLNGKTFSKLSQVIRSNLLTQGLLRAIIILDKTNKFFKFEVFTRLNTGGTTLNPQEIRNSTYPGNLNRMIYGLIENKDYRLLLGISRKSYIKSNIYKEMRDAELILRFLAFKNEDVLSYYSVQTRLNLYMHENLDKDDEWIQNEKQSFELAIKNARRVFGKLAFRRWDKKHEIWWKRPLSSLYESQIIVCYRMEESEVELAFQNKKKTQRLMKKFTLGETYDKYFRAGTNQKGFFEARIRAIRELIAESIG